ncbi:MAG: sulfatase-like hydrolase/transferase [Deltaproteobacteria bacterium]|nr:sulfatase-like hydrolase/transferase [Deltaproteobacteria bacterium]
MALGAGLGGALLGLATTSERMLLHGWIYAAPWDRLVHLAWAILVATVATALVGLVGTLVYRLATGWPRRPSRRRLLLLGAILGGSLGVAIDGLVLRPSKYADVVPRWLAVVSLALVLSVACGAGLLLVHRGLEQRRRVVVALAVVALAAGAYVDLHRYMRSYGNIHLLLGIGMMGLAGFACIALVSGRSERFRKRLGAGLAAMCCSSALVLALKEPAPSARFAVLHFGSLEKTVIRHVLWPWQDGDGDGFAGGFWGTDCDDGSDLDHPLAWPHRSRHFACQSLEPPSPPPPPAAAAAPAGAERSIVWVIVDTLRTDGIEPFRPQFSQFAFFEGYRSCGSDTRGALTQLLGSQGCRPAALEASITRRFARAGLATGAFIQYEPASLRLFPAEIEDIYGAFDSLTIERTGEGVLDQASAWIAAQEGAGRPFFALVHLWGGHGPYRGAGNTARERYDAAVSDSLSRVAKLVAATSEQHIVVVMGDHGEEFGEHDGGAHALTLYEEILATPLMIRAPDLAAGADASPLGCPELIAMIRWLALDPGGTRPPEARRPGRFARADYPTVKARGPSAVHLRSLTREDGVKVIWDLSLDIWELYDLGSDPQERHNVAAARPHALRQAAKDLLAAMERCEGRDLEAPTRSR